jgi:hypothetical protein
MAQIPLDEKFVGLSASTPTFEKRSALINSESQTYTMQDFIDTVGGLPSYVEYNQTDKTIWNNGKGNIDTNLSFGEDVLQNNTTGSANTGYGFRALSAVSTGSANTAVGYGSMLIGNGGGNTSIGASAGFSLQTGSNNVFLGERAGLSTSSGSGNVIIGKDSNVAASNTNSSIAIGLEAEAGSYSIAIGSEASSGGFEFSIALGFQATATASNQFVVGSSSYNVGAVTTETVSSTKTWTVVINGVERKILLA